MRTRTSSIPNSADVLLRSPEAPVVQCAQQRGDRLFGNPRSGDGSARMTKPERVQR